MVRTTRTPGRSRRHLLGAALAAATLLATVGCTSDDDGDGAATTTTGTDHGRAPAAVTAALTKAIDAAPGCDWLDPSRCLFPFPSSHFETADADTETGVRLALTDAVLPSTTKGEATDPTPFNAADGWGVGSPIMLSVPDVDLAASGWASEADLAASVTADSGSVLLDLDTGKRLAHWAEVDDRPELTDEQRTTVLLRPAELLPEGHRVAVALRTPTSRTGHEIPASPGFTVYRDDLSTTIDEVEQRRPAMERLFRSLDEAGVDRDGLYLAWDFQVVSTTNLTGDLLTMRDRAFEQLGDQAPTYTIDTVRTAEDDGSPLPTGIAKQIRGTFDVPSFLTGDGAPGATMTRDEQGDPVPTGTYHAFFTCSLTTRQLDGTAAARPVVYGHGLLGNATEAERGDLGTAAADLMLCGTYWTGMSDPDVAYAVSTLQNLNGFPSVADRLRQGIVNQLFLGRLIGMPTGLAADPQLAKADGTTSLDTSEVFYEGHSQGGIMGFAATAVSNEWSKAIIGVPAVNYAFIIPRSNNWQTYGPIIAQGYPDPIDALVVLGLLQQQWDRGEGSGYVRHVLGGLPGTQDHQVIVEVALSDHQVANAGSDLAARTAGIPVRTPVVGEGRLPWPTPAYGLETVGAGDNPTSIMEYWDAGTMPIPLGSRSPDTAPAWTAACTGAAAETAPCLDPHEYPRRTPAAQAQRNTFFATGRIEDPCGEDPCRTVPRNGDGQEIGG
jgi:hypothetical protein